YNQGGRHRFLDALGEEGRPAVVREMRADGGPRGLGELPPERRRERVIDLLRERIASVVMMPAGGVGEDRPPEAVGLGSLMAMDLKSGIEADLGVSFSLSILLQGPTLNRLADEALARWDESAAETTPAVVRTASPELVRDYPLTPGQRALWSIQMVAP